MTCYRRVLALVDFDRHTGSILEAAASLAQGEGCCLALGHVIDWGMSLGCDDDSPQTPAAIEDRLRVVVKRKLSALAHQGGVPDASLLVAVPPGGDMGDLVRGFQPDVVVSTAARVAGFADAHRLVIPGWWSCDIRIVDVSRLAALHNAAAAMLPFPGGRLSFHDIP